MKHIRCAGCHLWFDGKLAACSHCGHVRPAFNKSLRTASLNGHLGQQAASANREKAYESALGG